MVLLKHEDLSAKSGLFKLQLKEGTDPAAPAEYEWENILQDKMNTWYQHPEEMILAAECFGGLDKKIMETGKSGAESWAILIFWVGNWMKMPVLHEFTVSVSKVITLTFQVRRCFWFMVMENWFRKWGKFSSRMTRPSMQGRHVNHQSVVWRRPISSLPMTSRFGRTTRPTTPVRMDVCDGHVRAGFARCHARR